MDAERDAEERDSERDAQTDTNEDASLPGDPVAGEALYATHCALCHGAEGRGYVADNAPAIANADYLRFASDAFLFAATYDGRPGTPMSAWGDAHGGPFDEDEAWDVVALIRSWATLPFEDVSGLTVSGDAERGAAIYTRDCARCHGDAGQGDTATTLNNAVFQDTASDGFILRTIELGRRGTDMPAYDDTLSAPELADVVRFVRTLRADPPAELPIEDPPTIDELVLNPDSDAPSFTLRDGRYVSAADVHAAFVAGQRMVLLDARAA
ncbi:MAG: c-type cytochrome, partial [Rhodospirillales bacterium]|nr:c-type cytochrome [Rhodospirillales bacterium]